MPRLTIDNRPIEVPAGTTILAAARALGIDIPTLCHRDGIEPLTSCMVCLVKVEGRPTLVPSCAALADEGLVVHSDTPEVLSARRTAMELLLSDHLGDCEGPCHSACPAHMNIPLMIRHIRAGRLGEAIAVVKEDIALPAVLGRICPAPCERVCRRSAKDSPVAICQLKRFAADADLAAARQYSPPLAATSGKKVAIVGAGPTGLACAYHLLRAGHACTVFDENAAPGGALRSAIPEERLPKAVLDAEIDVIRGMGAVFRCGVRVGRDVALDGLRREYDAVAIAVGALRSPGDALGLPAGEHAIHADPHTHTTSMEKVFAAGAAVGPHRMAVRAEAGGKGMAAAIGQLLAGLPVTGLRRPFTVHIGALKEGEIGAFVEAEKESRTFSGKQTGPVVPAKVRDLEEVPDPFSAEAEASRCLHCDCRKAADCRLRDHSQALGAHGAHYRSHERKTFSQEATHPRVLFESGKCIRCGLCVRITELRREEVGLSFVGRGFDVRVAVPLDGRLAEALAKTAEECVAACPTGALAWKD